VVYTDRQIRLIRDRLVAYYDVESRGLVRATWGGLCDEIFEIAGIQMDDEVLRQFAKRATRKDRPDRPRLPSAENLAALVKFLCHEDIDMLSIKELQEPEIPYGLARCFSDFLRADSDGENLPPPTAINGSYRAEFKGPGTLAREIELSVAVDAQSSLVRLFEHAESFSPKKGLRLFEHAKSYLSKIDSRGNQASSRREASQRVESEGWGILTPEDNMFVFMKGKHYGSNYYYLTLGMDKNLRSESPIAKLLLLRHQYPVQQSNVPQSFDELNKESDGDTILLNFYRLEEIESDGGKI
jgi:hypothetical protein